MTLAATADAVGTEIATALKDLERGAEVSEQAWQIVCQKIAAWIAAEAVVTIPAGSINTAGSASAQVGPPSPVAIPGGIS